MIVIPLYWKPHSLWSVTVRKKGSLCVFVQMKFLLLGFVYMCASERERVCVLCVVHFSCANVCSTTSHCVEGRASRFVQLAVSEAQAFIDCSVSSSVVEIADTQLHMLAGRVQVNPQMVWSHPASPPKEQDNNVVQVWGY